jgi:hypothetical protein
LQDIPLGVPAFIPPSLLPDNITEDVHHLVAALDQPDQEWWNYWLANRPTQVPQVVPEGAIIPNFSLTIIDIAKDFWLQDILTNYLSQLLVDETQDAFNDDDDHSLAPVVITGEHPSYEFHAGEFVAVLADKEPFWLAQVTKVEEMTVYFDYYHHSPLPKAGENIKMKWTLHNTTGNCNITDVLVRFKTEAEIFTKTKTLRNAARRKIV